nr:3'-5' exonuclease [Bacteroidota bacterium]
MYLFFDTETTGLPRNWKAPVTDVNNWPRLVQLAFSLYDKEGGKILAADYIIKPEGFTIPVDASRVHGITTERAMDEGVALMDVLIYFQSQIEKSQTLVAHNMSFDEKIMGAEFLRNNMQDSIATPPKLCTMLSATKYCGIEGPYGFKWPKLTELHMKLFNHDFGEAHNAAADIAATVKCFFELKKIGVM